MSDVLGAARHAMDAAGAPLLLAVSGGLDSMVLLHAVCAVARDRIIAVATFDHGTGRAATRAVSLVCEAAGRHSLPMVVGHIDTGANSGEGREAAWRHARHGFLFEAAARVGARVAMAHTEDDQVETTLMRIMRGSGHEGWLVSMPNRRF